MSDLLADGRVKLRLQGWWDDFGVPVSELILTLRHEDHLTWNNVAGVLGISERMLRRYRRALGLPLDGQVYHDEATYSVRDSKRERAARAAGYPTIKDAIIDLRFVQKKTRAETAKALGLAPGTISRLTPAELSHLYNVSPEARQAMRINGLRLGSRAKPDHPWAESCIPRR